MSMLQLNNVTKSFGKLTAVDNLTLEIPAGKIYGFLGPNGAGKTTTIRMILEIIIPDKGHIKYFDGMPFEKAKDKIGYLPEERGLYKKMKIEDTILFFASLKGMAVSDAKVAASEWLKKFDLYDRKDEDVEALSKGNQQKIQFISTIIHNPEILIFDEPFAGFDPVNVDIIKDIILDLKKNGKTIVFSTHLMEQVEKICDEICLINKGRKVVSGDIKDVKNKYGQNTVSIEYKGDISFLDEEKSVKSYNDFGHYADVILNDGESSSLFLRKIVDRLEIYKFQVKKPSLHQIFVDIVKSN